MGKYNQLCFPEIAVIKIISWILLYWYIRWIPFNCILKKGSLSMCFLTSSFNSFSIKYVVSLLKMTFIIKNKSLFGLTKNLFSKKTVRNKNYRLIIHFGNKIHVPNVIG